MREGWHGEEYLVLFAAQEALWASERYKISAMLPGFRVVGLRGWDDFIVQAPDGEIFTVPTVPCDAKQLTPYHLPSSTSELACDERYKGKLKWYIKPIAFGGDPGLSANLTWVSHEEHVELVRWWNARYRGFTLDDAPGVGGPE